MRNVLGRNLRLIRGRHGSASITIKRPAESIPHNIQRVFFEVSTTRRRIQSTRRLQPSKCGYIDSKRAADCRDGLRSHAIRILVQET